jgi:Secretion system C-terminal sorting domain
MRTFILSTLFIVSFNSLMNAQTYTCTLTNFTSWANNVFEFDIMLASPSANVQFKHAYFGIDFNYTGLINGGTLNASSVIGSSTTLLPVGFQNIASMVWLDPISHQIRIELDTTMISTANAVFIQNTQLLLTKIRITNTVPFPPCISPNLQYSFVNSPNTTVTKCTFFVNSLPNLYTTQTSFNYFSQGPELYIQGNAFVQPYQIAATNVVSTCDSLLWHGQYYTHTGIYHDTVSQLGGCDSVYTLNLFVDDGVTSTTMGCDSFLWNSNNIYYAVNGTYTNSYTNANGCLVHDTLNLTVHPSGGGTTTTATAFWSYYWLGSYYYLNGTYYHTSLNQYGCPKQDTLVLNIYGPTNVSNLNSDFHITTYPNPTKDVLNIFCDDKSIPDATIYVHDITGKLFLFNKRDFLKHKQEVLSVASLPSGIYFLEIQSHEQRIFVTSFLKK